jgi:fermentation-respiration switch protein FrsA (DUF1100 family)
MRGPFHALSGSVTAVPAPNGSPTSEARKHRRHRWVIRSLTSISLALLTGYLAILGFLYGRQRPLLYGNGIGRVTVTPDSVGLSQAQSFTLSTPDGALLSMWFVPPNNNTSPVFLYFHGKEGSLRQRAGRIKAMSATGSGVLALDYRGFGASTGSPTEAGLYSDGETAYRWLAARVEPKRIVLMGESLGTGIAVWLASRQPAAALILQSPYTSVADLAARSYPLFPVRLLMQDQFHSDLLIDKVHMPVLIQHGEKDTIVPIIFGERLYALANQPKRFLVYPSAAHNDLPQFGAYADAAAFALGAMESRWLGKNDVTP